MKLKNVIEGGIAGATTLSLLQEALHKIDNDAPRPFLHQSGVIRKLKKSKKRKGHYSDELLIKLAGELLAGAGYFGLAGLGKKKNAVLRGGLLGAAAGLGAAFLKEEHKPKAGMNGIDHHHKAGVPINRNEDEIKDKLLTIGLYTAGGLLAGWAIKEFNKKGKKKGGFKKAAKWLKEKNKAW